MVKKTVKPLKTSRLKIGRSHASCPGLLSPDIAMLSYLYTYARKLNHQYRHSGCKHRALVAPTEQHPLGPRNLRYRRLHTPPIPPCKKPQMLRWSNLSQLPGWEYP